MGPMRRQHLRVGGAIAFVAGCLWTSEFSMAQSVEAKTISAISITGRNGSNALSATLVELSRFSKDPRFAEALAMPDSVVKFSAPCAASARRDPSGRVFDMAQCADIWPGDEHAPRLKSFEAEFADAVGKSGVSAFPAVRVKPFVFQLQIPETALPWARFSQGSDGDLVLSKATQESLCNPKITFVDRQECEAQITVVKRASFLPAEIRVAQTGYRIEFLKEMPERVARSLAEELRQRVGDGGGAYSANVNISVGVPSAGGKPQQSQSLSTIATAASQPVDYLERFSRPWQRVGIDPGEVELDIAASNHTAPTIFLFDKDADPVDLATWYQGLRSRLSKAAGDCEGFHTDASASLFFPKSLPMMLQSLYAGIANSAAGSDFDPTLDGHILTPLHLTTNAHLGYRLWYLPGADVESPIDRSNIAVVVFTDPHGEQQDARAGNALAGMLSDRYRSNLLVVAAPRVVDAGFSSYERGVSAHSPSSSVDSESLVNGCRGKAWPSCLGRHPRVLVVAPAEQTEGKQPQLPPGGAYVLGASTVRLAAPGFGVPVVQGCPARANTDSEGATAAVPVWRTTDVNGSSVAAPIVGAALAQLLHRGSAQMRMLPESGIWRLLSTSDPVYASDSLQEGRSLVAFGHLNVARALLGVRETELGGWNNATIYPMDTSKPSQAVVSAYPWSDNYSNLNPYKEGERRIGMEGASRGYLVFSEKRNDAWTTQRPIELKRLLRISRNVGSANLFDIYYLSALDDSGTAMGVVAKYGIQIGIAHSKEIGAEGFCRLEDSYAASGSAQPQPACLYKWNAGSDGQQFQPLDLTSVRDIVFPPNHLDANLVNKINPRLVSRILAANSPWRTELCLIGPRSKAKAVLVNVDQMSTICAIK